MRIGLASLGCAKNLVDSEVMLGLLRDAGHQITADAGDADVLVVNTCAFVEEARQESIDTILEMASLEGHRGRRLIVTGCLAERYRDELLEHVPEIDVLLGTDEVEAIVEAVNGRQAPPAATFGERAPRAARHRDRQTPPPTYLYDERTPRHRTTPKHYAYLKVAEGCDYNCAFCIIPVLRGPYRSRTARSIVDEARSLVAEGVREILLISQDTTFYGVDRRERNALVPLLRELDQIPGLARIRLLYLYPTTLSDEVLDAMAECDKVCPYVDLPLQHAAGDVLRRMRRPGGRREYEALLDRVRRTLGDATLRTTVIVGFPGETEADFGELRSFIESVEFDHLGVFTYSHEEGTAAYGLPDDVPPAVKAARRSELMRIQRRIVGRRNRGRLGQTVEVMVDGPSPEHELVLQGRLAGQAPEIDPVVYLTDCDPEVLVPGSVHAVRVVAARGYDLVARPLS